MNVVPTETATPLVGPSDTTISHHVVMKMLSDPATPLLPAGHHIRITQTGKMRLWIGHALPWLKLHPEVPLVFHTLPPSHLPVIPAHARRASASDTDNIAGPSEPTEHVDASRSFRPVSTITISRLISVIELVKREYQASFSASELEDGKGRMWQYNASGDLRTAERSVGSKGKRRELGGNGTAVIGQGVDHELVGMLEAGGNIKMSHSPYMVTVLSARPLTHLQATRNITYQPVPPPPSRARTKRGKPQPYESQEDKARRLYDEAQARKAAAMPGSRKGNPKRPVRFDSGEDVEEGSGAGMEVDELEEAAEEPDELEDGEAAEGGGDDWLNG